MEHILPSSLERIIWRYLRNEERHFLELVFPGETFTDSPIETKKTVAPAETKAAKSTTTHQDIANFAAATGWIPALEVLKPHIDLNKALVAAVIGKHEGATNWLIQRGAEHSDQSLKYAAAAGNHRYLTQMRGQINVLEWKEFPPICVDALKSAAEKGHAESIFVLGRWRNTTAYLCAITTEEIDKILWLAICSDKINAMTAAELVLKDLLCSKNYNKALIGAAAFGLPNAIHWLDSRRRAGVFRYGDTDSLGTLEAVNQAIQNNHLAIAEELWGWCHVYVKIINPYLLLKSAGSSSLQALHLVKRLGVTNFSRALISAAAANKIENMRLVKEWNDFTQETIDDAFGEAAGSGSIAALELLRSWGAADYNNAFEEAALYGEIQSMKVLKGWGANNFDKALVNIMDTADENEIPVMILLKEWGATRFREALRDHETRENRNEDEPCDAVIELLQSWIAT